MAKLHDTSVTGNINASGTIYANGKAVAPLDHTHSVDAITGLEQSVKNIVNSAPVNTATNTTQLGGKPADQYALKTDLTALGERLNQVQYSITKVFKTPNYVSYSYDNKYVKITLSDRMASVNKVLIIEDATKKFIIDTFTVPGFTNNKIIFKDKADVELYNNYSDTVPIIYRVSDTTFIVGGICIKDNELASITLQSNEPITTDDFTISGRDRAYNLNDASAKKVVSSRDLIPHFAEKYIDTQKFGYLYTIKKPGTYDRRLDLHLDSTTSTVYIYTLNPMSNMALGVNGNGIVSYNAANVRNEPSVAISGLTVYIDLSTISDDFVILGDCTATYSTTGLLSSTPPKDLPQSIGSGIDENRALSFNKVLDLLGRSVTINGAIYDTKYDININRLLTFPATYINDQSVTIGSMYNTITARANGGNADTVGGLSPNSFITTDNLARKYYSKVAVYDNDNHLIHPDGTEEWIEYQRPVASEDNLDHL